MNFIIGKSKFYYLKIVLDSIVISSIVLGKHTKTLRKKIPLWLVGRPKDGYSR